MTRCLDEVKLQSYLDGELPLELMESVTSHLASCATCAAAAREMEEELALLTTALSAEFEASVPTERLRQRIDEAVLGDRLAVARTTEKSSGLAAFFAGLLNFGTQRTLGYASVAVVLALAAIFAVVKMKSTPDQSNVATGNQPQAPKVNQVNTPSAGQVASNNPPEQPTVNDITLPADSTAPIDRAPVHQVKYTPARVSQPRPAPVKLLPGERSYLQAIARLDSTINSNKGMRPGLQVEYERNLAVVDRAIAATRSAVKSNPNDPDAADFMFAAYQSKVDLLNTIADARVGGGGRGH